MNDIDDRLAGDPVWELFPQRGPAREVVFGRRGAGWWLGVVFLAGLTWSLYPPAAVLIACLSVAVRDFRAGGQLARSLSDKISARICARFSFAWGAWKVGVAAFVLMFVLLGVFAGAGKMNEPPPGFFAAMLLVLVSFMASAALTAWGLFTAYRYGMRVWIGEGVNRARTLLLAMLIVGFAFLVLLPWAVWLVGALAPPAAERAGTLFVAGLLSIMSLGAFGTLMILDWLSRCVVSASPGKFGPKVPTVGKWKP
jgi:hypothetical protein